MDIKNGINKLLVIGNHSLIWDENMAETMQNQLNKLDLYNQDFFRAFSYFITKHQDYLGYKNVFAIRSLFQKQDWHYEAISPDEIKFIGPYYLTLVLTPQLILFDKPLDRFAYWISDKSKANRNEWKKYFFLSCRSSTETGSFIAIPFGAKVSDLTPRVGR
jgi:hypothetical protein